MLHRHATSALLDGLRDTPVVYLQGARQTGKSTLARAVAERRHPARYVTLDTAAALAAATSDPEGFVAGLERPVVIDEVQRAPALALAIKAAVDADRRPGQFLLTGSAGVLALPRLSESLAGRMELHTLWPFSQGELRGVRETFVDRMFAARLAAPGTGAASTGATPGTEAPPETQADLIERICKGGYPEAQVRESRTRRRAWFDAYVDAILQRDVRELANIERLSEIPRLLALLASRVSQPLSFADLARTLAIPQTTLKRYMALMETTFLVRLLPAWSSNLGKRLAKAPKLMLADTGLLAHMLGVEAGRLRRDRTLLGHVLENFAAMELTKQLGWSETACRLFHFRTPGGAEVDLVLEDRAGRLVGIEVKAAAVQRRDFRGLETLAALAGERFVRGVLLFTGATAVPFGPQLHALPVSQVWA